MYLYTKSSSWVTIPAHFRSNASSKSALLNLLIIDIPLSADMTSNQRPLKRKLDDSCIICGCDDGSPLSKTTCIGLGTLHDAAQSRCDERMRAILDMPGSAGDSSDIAYHRNCYKSYTSKHNIPALDTAIASNGNSPDEKNVLTRGDVQLVDQKSSSVCFICNMRKHKGSAKLRTSTAEQMRELLSLADQKNDRDVRRRLEMAQLLDKYVTYHDQCRREFTRVKDEKSDSTPSIPFNFEKLCQVIENTVILGETPMTILELSRIYEEFGEPATPRPTLQGQILRHFGDRIRVCARHGQGQSSIIYSSAMRAAIKLVDANSNAHDSSVADSFSIPDHEDPSLNDAEYEVYLGLVRYDIKKSRGIEKLQISNDQVMECVLIS